MKENLCHIVLVVDASHNAVGRELKLVQGLNVCFAALKKAACDVDLSVFAYGGGVSDVFAAKPAQMIPAIRCSAMNFAGEAILWDAVSAAMDQAGDFFARQEEHERPEKVIFVTLALGECEGGDVTPDAVAEKIVHQRDVYKWDISFISSAPDVLQFAESVGVASCGFAASGADMARAFQQLSVELLTKCGGEKPVQPPRKALSKTVPKAKAAIKSIRLQA